MHADTKLHYRIFHFDDYLEQLIISGYIDQLLCQIVSKRITHKLSELIDYFSKYYLQILWVFFNCLLKIPASTLVFAKLISVRE